MKKLISDFISKRKNDSIMDEREILEFNKIILICFKLVIILVTQYAVFQNLQFFLELGKATSILGIVGFCCFVGSCGLCHKGILFYNRHYDILLPTFLFFPFLLFKLEDLFVLHVCQLETSLFISILMILINVLIIYLILNTLYRKRIKEIDLSLEENDDYD